MWGELTNKQNWIEVLKIVKEYQILISLNSIEIFKELSSLQLRNLFSLGRISKKKLPFCFYYVFVAFWRVFRAYFTWPRHWSTTEHCFYSNWQKLPKMFLKFAGFVGAPAVTVKRKVFALTANRSFILILRQAKFNLNCKPFYFAKYWKTNFKCTTWKYVISSQ